MCYVIVNNTESVKINPLDKIIGKRHRAGIPIAIRVTDRTVKLIFYQVVNAVRPFVSNREQWNMNSNDNNDEGIANEPGED